jgi:hypothetical protein
MKSYHHVEEFTGYGMLGYPPLNKKLRSGNGRFGASPCWNEPKEVVAGQEEKNRVGLFG